MLPFLIEQESKHATVRVAQFTRELFQLNMSQKNLFIKVFALLSLEEKKACIVMVIIFEGENLKLVGLSIFPPLS